MTLEESLEHLLSQKDSIIQRFYERFLAAHPEVQSLFAQVDLKRQAAMLTMALVVVEANARKSYPAIDHYLLVLGNRHRHIGVSPELFPVFRDLLLETIAGSQQEFWSEDLAAAWRDAFDKVTAKMLEGYEGEHPF